MAVALVDYGAGNLTSVRKALAAVGAEVFTPATPADLERASGVIVPGVGHFGATRALDAAWRAAVRRHVDRGRPLLGICLGLQWLFEGSAEAPGVAGLGLFPGTCFLLGTGPTAWADDVPDDGGPAAGSGGGGRDDALPARLKVPHVGWNALRIRRPSRLLADVADGAQAYFTHSYAAPVTADCVATTTHGQPFASVVERELVAGVQWHPEKSGAVGLAVLRAFVGLVGGR